MIQEIVRLYENPNSIGFISGLKCDISESSRIVIDWEWPPFDSKINYALAYSVTGPDEPLDAIIARDAKKWLIPRGTNDYGGHCFSLSLTEKTLCLKLYSVNISKDTMNIYEQDNGNITPVFHKRIILRRRVKYDNKTILSGFHVASFVFEDIGILDEIPENALLIYKFNKSDGTIRAYYPFSLKMAAGGEYGIYVEKECQIDLICASSFQGAIVIRDY